MPAFHPKRPSAKVTQIKCEGAKATYGNRMDSELIMAENPQQLVRIAAQLEQVAQFMSRPDARMHIIEKAAECLARAAMIRAARGVSPRHA